MRAVGNEFKLAKPTLFLRMFQKFQVQTSCCSCRLHNQHLPRIIISLYSLRVVLPKSNNNKMPKVRLEEATSCPIIKLPNMILILSLCILLLCTLVAPVPATITEYTFSQKGQLPTSNAISEQANSKKSLDLSASQQQQQQHLSKLQKYLSERQHELVTRNPGSLKAVVRAFKMAIAECQYQMRHEPWDCPIYGFSIRPPDVFAAIAHSVARACTEASIQTCGRTKTREGDFQEDIDFGRQFARDFMDATHELSAWSTVSNSNNNNNNNIIAGSGPIEPNRRERRIRDMINAHNDEVGRLQVLNNMRRVCKCHGLSGACTVETCWLKLPSFREVANLLHESLDQAIRVIYVSHNPTNRQKLLTSATVKKSNKKRSSIQQPVNGLGRSSTSPSTLNSYSNSNSHTTTNPSLIGDTASIIGSRQRGTKRHTSPDNCEDCYRSPVESNGGKTQTIKNALGDNQETTKSPTNLPSMSTNSTSLVKKRPVARSIGFTASTISPGKLDFLYNEESPDFCIRNDRYNFKGTRGRVCSENPNVSNNCETLCCGRGFKTEVREEEYKCECQFRYCCKLDCNTCTRRKVIYKCL